MISSHKRGNSMIQSAGKEEALQDGVRRGSAWPETAAPCKPGCSCLRQVGHVAVGTLGIYLPNAAENAGKRAPASFGKHARLSLRSVGEAALPPTATQVDGSRLDRGRAPIRRAAVHLPAPLPHDGLEDRHPVSQSAGLPGRAARHPAS